MDNHLRVNIAYIAARRIRGGGGSSAFDYARGVHKTISGSVTKNSVAIFDHERGAHISGSCSSLYDYSLGGHVSLNVRGNHFSGFDYRSGHHFSGNVSGNSVTVFDYGVGQHFHYST